MAKRGRLSDAERQFIIDNSTKLTPQEIAEKLDRTTAMIAEFIDDLSVPSPSAEQPLSSRNLRETAEWRELKKQFTSDELVYFQDRWATWMLQFKEDMMASEETQVFILLKTEMLMNRNLAEKKTIAVDLKNLEKLRDDIYSDHPNIEEMDDSQKALVLDITKQIDAIRAGQQARTIEWLKLNEQHSELMKQLKATRDQRLKKIENYKTSFVDVIKELMKEEARIKAGEEMELMAIAGEKERERLTKLHTYIDGSTDYPILDSKSVEGGSK